VSLISLNRRRERRPVALGPVLSWPRTAEHVERVQAALARAKDSGELDLADFYAFQLKNSKLANTRALNDPGSAA
jgi:hypothetical protein